jgi:membrane-associated phospholipid phosphatase
MTTSSISRDSAPAALLSAVGAAATMALLVWFALGSQRGQAWDDSAMGTVVGGRDTQLAVLSVLGYVSIGAIIVVVGACAFVAMARGKFMLAAGAAAVIVGSNVTTQLLKHSILDRPNFGLGTMNSLPSGHTTVVASAVGASLLVAPRLWRPLLALLGGFATTLTGASTVVAGWHRPSDVIAALAVSLIWTAAIAVIVHGPAAPVGGPLVGGLLGSGAAVIFLIAIGVRPVMGWDGFFESGLVLGAIAGATAVFVTAASISSPEE